MCLIYIAVLLCVLSAVSVAFGFFSGFTSFGYFPTGQGSLQLSGRRHQKFFTYCTVLSKVLITGSGCVGCMGTQMSEVAAGRFYLVVGYLSPLSAFSYNTGWPYCGHRSPSASLVEVFIGSSHPTVLAPPCSRVTGLCHHAVPTHIAPLGSTKTDFSKHTGISGLREILWI